MTAQGAAGGDDVLCGDDGTRLLREVYGWTLEHRVPEWRALAEAINRLVEEVRSEHPT